MMRGGSLIFKSYVTGSRVTKLLYRDCNESGATSHLSFGLSGASVCSVCQAGTYWTGSGLLCNVYLVCNKNNAQREGHVEKIIDQKSILHSFALLYSIYKCRLTIACTVSITNKNDFRVLIHEDKYFSYAP